MKKSKTTKLTLSLLALLGSVSVGLASCANQDQSNSSSLEEPNTSESKSAESSTNQGVESIEINATSLSLAVGEKKTLEISVSPSSFSAKNLSFEYDAEIISFNKETLEISALKVGSTTLKIKGGSIEKEVAIAVTEAAKVTSLTCSISKKTMNVGDTFQLEIGYLPAEAAAPNLFFYSDDTSVVSVSKTGLLKAVAKGSANVLVSVKGDTSVSSLSVAITVTEDKEEVNRDNLIAKVEEASANEATDIKGGSLSIVTKMNNRAESSFTNNFSIYSDRIYNDIKGYDDVSYTLAYIKGDDGYLYTDVINSDETSTKNKNKIEENSAFSTSYTSAQANKMIGNVAFYSTNISKSYTYGIGSYIESEIINSIFLGYDSSKYSVITPIENGVKLSLKRATYTTKEIHEMEILFSEKNFAKITYDYECYNEADISESYVPNEGAATKEDYHFEANFTKGERVSEAEQRVDYNDFYYSDFDVDFSSASTKNSLTFYRGETITYALKSFAPSEASDNIDRIQVVSSSDENVITVSQNKLAVIAGEPGTATVTLQSKNVTKTYNLTVKLQPATSLTLSDGYKDVLSSNETMRFKYSLEPWGAIDDITIDLTEESKQYATLEKNGDYYVLTPVKNFSVDKAEVTLQFRSESNPDLNMDKVVTITRKLTSVELKAILTASKFVSEPNADFDNAKVIVTFDEDQKCVATIYNKNGKVYDTFNCQYAISNGSLAIMNNSKSENEYLSSLEITTDRADLSSIKVKFYCEEDDEDYGGSNYEFRCYKESK